MTESPDRDGSAVRAWLELRLRPGVGDRGLARLRERLGSATAVRRALAPAPDAAAIADRADRALRRADALGARAVCVEDPDYPARLLRLADPPPVVFVQGEANRIHHAGVTVVGSRRATEYGRRVAARLADALVRRGMAVISGLARGIDSAAHRGALEVGGTTVAVLGAGPGVSHGARDRLRARIARDGALMTEFLPDEPAAPHHFPRRNRILAALGHAVVVVEAAERSGALITVRHALEVGTAVWAVPGPVGRDSARGTLRLIEDGARIVVDIEEAAHQMAEDAAITTPAPSRAAPDSHVSRGWMPASEEDPVLAVVGGEPVGLDRIVTETGMDPSDVTRRMLSLEMRGAIRQLPGLRYVRADP